MHQFSVVSIPWVLGFDGFACSIDARLRIKIITLSQRIYEHSIRFPFTMSNNVVEYEAVNHNLKIVKMNEAITVKVKTELQLVTRQATKEFDGKEPQIIKYATTLE